MDKKENEGFFFRYEITGKQIKKEYSQNEVVLCFVPRMRMFAPILAGSIKLPFRRFLLFESIALVAFTTIYLLIGFIFNRSLQKVIKQAKGLQNVIFFGALLIVAVVIILLNEEERSINQMKRIRAVWPCCFCQKVHPKKCEKFYTKIFEFQLLRV